jgi:hypothetical protein
MVGPEGVWALADDKRATPSRTHNEARVKTRFMDSSSWTHGALALTSFIPASGKPRIYSREYHIGFEGGKRIVMTRGRVFF